MVIETLLTKRGFVVALIAFAALLGAGFGFLPGTFGDGDDDSGPATTTGPDSLPEDGTTDAVREVETVETTAEDETTARAATTRPPSESTKTATATGADASSTTDDQPDVSVTPTTSEDSAEATVEEEVNVSVGADLAIPPAVAG